MRRAFQRCSASLPRSLSTFAPASRTAQQCLRLSQMPTSTLHRLPALTRTLHQTSRLRRQAAAQEDEIPSTDGGNAPITKFVELGSRGVLHENVVQTLTRDMGMETMTEVQSATINEALKGSDVIAQARTGTGKTLAFLLPILQNIINVDPDLARRTGGRRGPRTTADDIRALIISPTRELAEQIADEARKLTRNTGVIVQTAVGGTQKSAGLRAIQREGCHLLVGTPGRLKDILTDPYTRVEAPDLSALVLDEADRLLDQGFWPEIQEIMRLLPTPAEKDRQTMMFSATIPREVVNLVRSTLKPGFQFVKCVKEDEQPTHERVLQKMVRISGFENSLPTLIEICQKGFQDSKNPGARPFKAIVYYNSTAEVTLAASTLQGLQPTAQEGQDAFGARHPWSPARIYEIHAKLTQSQRTRAAEDFKNCTSGILISSDVTARGMDFPNVTHVIQMGLPTSSEQYVHRIGRTARAGKEGEGWIVLNKIEADEARSRLRGLPLQKDTSLSIPALDLTKAADVPASAGRILSMYQKAVQRVPMSEKAKVYLAQLGIFAWYPRKSELVESMNNLSQFGWGLKTPPAVPYGLAQKLRINRIEGIQIGNSEAFSDSRGPPGRGRDDSGSFRGRGGSEFGGRDSGFGGRSGDRGGFAGRDDRFGGRSGGRRDSDGGRPHYGRGGDRSQRRPAFEDPFN
ncbi:hypothetical protein DOTSEDRAFT_70586 [Dothistroma septosporum NZE10]|uniref:ATP-dependent RNA helicase n=1 Tax=Dothistroma septosporum (strain NZE10 / CBS 128990) TaxID=675120 RepID=N1PT45_DOTSN|nr:hypothetical protein DOTSEDRAFT_70586 [Dothistroma septosporum NZE10]